MGAGLQGTKAATLGAKEVVEYPKEYVAWLDAHNPIAPASHPLAKPKSATAATAAASARAVSKSVYSFSGC